MTTDTAPRERPILFSAPMVRALLSGAKTQTRRIVKPQPAHGVEGCQYTGTGWAEAAGTGPGHCTCKPVRCPYGAPGDQLWVRETWHYIDHQNGPRGLEVCVGYPADGESLPNRPSHVVPDPERWADKVDAWPFKRRRWPAIHMPRWASRITLRITDIRVERLNDCSEADALAEGIGEHPCPGPHRGPDATYFTADPNAGEREALGRVTPVAAYKALWEHISGEGAWDKNPWVWAVTFERVAA